MSEVDIFNNIYTRIKYEFNKKINLNGNCWTDNQIIIVQHNLFSHFLSKSNLKMF